MYLHGYDALGAFLGMGAKSARALDRRLKFPRIEIPGVKRNTLLFKISDIDAALLPFHIEGPQAPPRDVVVDEILQSILNPRVGAR
jgi:hypothetical protein